MGHTAELKEKVVQIALKGNLRHQEIVNKYGVELSTLQKWLKAYRAGENKTMTKPKEKRPQGNPPEN